jgi:pimeloyl-ACP methyl ester carboxylesterase
MSDSVQYTTGSTISKDGTTIGWRKLGQGPGLVLIHGGMLSSQHFMRLATVLSDAFTLYVVDRRGRGLSGPHGQNYNLSRECEDIEAVIVATGARDLFALSSGAIVALQAALALPVIRKLALYEPPLSVNHSSPTGWVPRFDDEIAHGKIAASLVTAMKGMQASPVFSILPRFVLVPLMKLAGASQARSVQDGNVSLKELIPTQHFDMQLVIETEGALERFRDVHAEVLLIGGSKSQAFLRTSLEGLSSVLPNVQRIELEGLDHLGPANEGKPERVACELRRFFTQL